MKSQLWSVVPVWVLVLAAAVVVEVVADDDVYFTWIAIVLAGAVLGTFAFQIFTPRIEGFVSRTMASIGVSVLILAAASGIHVLLR